MSPEVVAGRMVWALARAERHPFACYAGLSLPSVETAEIFNGGRALLGSIVHALIG